MNQTTGHSAAGTSIAQEAQGSADVSTHTGAGAAESTSASTQPGNAPSRTPYQFVCDAYNSGHY